MHSSEPASHLADLAACALSSAVAPSVKGERFDVLLAISGAHPVRSDALGRVLRAAVAGLPPPIPRVEVTTVTLARDAYDRAAAQRGDTSWVSGPNSAFYDALLDGHIRKHHVAGYDYVQQLETDVCGARRGWLDTILAAARARPHALVVGATLAGDCVWIEAHGECERVGGGGPGNDGVLRSHVNGNALYRVNVTTTPTVLAADDLGLLLSLARSALGDGEPFDLALWRAAAAVGWAGRVTGVPASVNVGAPVDAARFTHPSYHGRLTAWPDARSSAVALVHAPRRLRTDGVRAAAARVAAGGVATVVVVSRADVDTGLLRHAAASLAGVDGVLWAAGDEAAYAAASALAPYRVVRGQGRAVAAQLLSTDRGVGVFVISPRGAVLDAGRYGAALAALGGVGGVFGECGGGGGSRVALPLLVPGWPPAVRGAFARWASQATTTTTTLASALAAVNATCRPLPPGAAGSVKSLAEGRLTSSPPAYVSASRLARRDAVRALTVVGAWRGDAAGAVRAWKKEGKGEGRVKNV
jgi:hypothetical protein